MWRTEFFKFGEPQRQDGSGAKYESAKRRRAVLRKRARSFAPEKTGRGGAGGCLCADGLLWVDEGWVWVWGRVGRGCLCVYGGGGPKREFSPMGL